MKRRTFTAQLLDGHKGPAVQVPFDPGKVWGALPVPVETAAYGRIAAHPVRGAVDGAKFDGAVVRRWGKFFLLVDDALRRAANAKVGDVVTVSLAPRSTRRRRYRRRA